MKRLFAISIVTTLLSITHLYAQKMNTDTQIFHPDFRTLKVQVENDFMSPPIIHLNGNDRITIMFDELSDDVRYMQYRLVHCNADWQPSMLLDSEFVDGFNIANVDDYAFSSNTFIHYVNYLITIPNDNIAPLISALSNVAKITKQKTGSSGGKKNGQATFTQQAKSPAKLDIGSATKATPTRRCFRHVSASTKLKSPSQAKRHLAPTWVSTTYFSKSIFRLHKISIR